MRIDYYEGDPAKGIIYDWKAIKREYDKLKCPKDVYQVPWDAIGHGNKYFISLSERSTGKTTNWLLVGLCINKLYGRVVQYVRATEKELAPSYADKLLEVINTYEGGRYVRQLTDGKFNSIYYHWKQFFYCNRDENGVVVEKSELPIVQLLSVDKNFDYKSTYNAQGDIIIFDEFIGKFYRPDECIHFMDLTKTIIRSRHTPIIVMLANTINLNSFYFEELEISRPVKQLRKGEGKELVTERGTKMFIEIVDVKRGETEKHIHNSLFYGFKNTKLASITGGELWAFETVPHILHRPAGGRIIYNKIYIETGTELLRVDFACNDLQGYHLEVHRATQTYDDSIILSLETVNDARYKYGFGSGKMKKIFDDMIVNRKIYYQSNEVGSIFKDYLNRYLTLKRNY